MQANKNPRVWFATVDRLLLSGSVILILLCAGLLIAWYPALWGRCLQILDVRNWTQWAWTGVGVALLVTLVLIRAWPGRRRLRKSGSGPP